ncbi:MAG: hypothetical protein ACD_79C00311G0001 [uncultured bacterium]|nr:MAG: hypothetical protein ACD_79C00311G0001 [uncultured bacterium]
MTLFSIIKKNSIVVFFLLILIILNILYLSNMSFFLEDNLIENIQLFLLFGCIFTSFRNYFNYSLIQFQAFSFISGLGFIFILFEEISWGQRLFNIPLPNFFLKYNNSMELNLHNINDGTLEQIMYFIFIFWALISLIKLKYYFNRLLRHKIPFFSRNMGMLFIFILILTQWSYSNSDKIYPELYETLIYLFFFIFNYNLKKYNFLKHNYYNSKDLEF